MLFSASGEANSSVYSESNNQMRKRFAVDMP